MFAIPKATTDHYRHMQKLRVLAVTAGRRTWKRTLPGLIRQSWMQVKPELVATLSAIQVQAAAAGSSYGALTLAQQGDWVPPSGFADPRTFGGYASDGRSLSSLLDAPAIQSLAAIKQGADPQQALALATAALDRIIATQVSDAARSAASVDLTARIDVGYVRMLNPPSCERCIILAGRPYRWNQGFLRHPNCDCVHVQATDSMLAAAEAEGLAGDPYEYFNSMSEAEQNRAFGRDGAEAIREGADIYQVVNSKRGMPRDASGRITSRLTTSEGMSRRGNYTGSGGTGARLTPEGIYAQAASREEAIELLRSNRYILPGGQVPGGSIRGQLEGYGQMGRGGTRIGARTAIDQARATGVRDPNVRATMTAAERRLFDARSDYELVLQGINPRSRNGLGLNPTISAQVETNFRRQLTTGGQQFTN